MMFGDDNNGGDPFSIKPDHGSDPLITVLKIGNQIGSQLVNQLMLRMPAATTTSLGITNSSAGGTRLVIGPGVLVSVSVTSPSTGGTGLIYDADTTITLGTSVAIGIVPSSGIITYNWPFTRGLVVQPSSGVTVAAVSYST